MDIGVFAAPLGSGGRQPGAGDLAASPALAGGLALLTAGGVIGVWGEGNRQRDGADLPLLAQGPAGVGQRLGRQKTVSVRAAPAVSVNEWKKETVTSSAPGEPGAQG
jgi:hypothetical protein